MKYLLKHYYSNLITLAAFGIPIICLHIGGAMATVALVFLWLVFAYIALVTGFLLMEHIKLYAAVVSAPDPEDKVEVTHDK